MSGRKKMARDEDTGDLVCGLPKILIDNILERLPIKDAVRTSILSRKWRYLWSARTTLVFDKQFFEMNFKNKLNPAYVYMIVMYNILLLRTEPILEFTVHIPKLSFDWNVHIDKCLLFLSRNGVQKLELRNMSFSPFQLPSCVFSCPTLKALIVQNCIYKPTKSVSEFVNLNLLSFKDMIFSPDICGDSVLVLPCLHNLTFLHCSGIENSEIVAPNLRFFIAIKSHDVKSFSFDKFPKLRLLAIALKDEIYEQERDDSFNIDNFLKKCPIVTRLVLNGNLLKASAVSTIDRRFSFTFRYLKCFELYRLNFDDLDQLLCALCLLRSSPNLEELTITALPCEDTTLELESVPTFLDTPNYMDEMLKLQKVNFVSKSCSRSELFFVKSLLTRSPSLQTLHFKCINEKCDGLKISNELLRFRRASFQAEIIYSCGTLASTKN